MFGMWVVRDVGCSRRGMFAGMWDVDLHNACEIDYWQKCLFVCLFAYLLVLATSYFNVKLLEHISCIPLSNYFHVHLEIQLKGKATFMSFFVSYTLKCFDNRMHFSELFLLH